MCRHPALAAKREKKPITPTGKYRLDLSEFPVIHKLPKKIVPKYNDGLPEIKLFKKPKAPTTTPETVEKKAQ